MLCRARRRARPADFPVVLFNSFPFLFFFLPIAYVVFWRLEGRTPRFVWLTITGYVFYSFWNYRFCALMAFSTLVSYLAGLGLLAWRDQRRRTLCLVVPVVTDLALLGFFKYTNLTLGTANHVGSWLGLDLHLPSLDIVLPVGISFYTFHTITYIVDSYRGVITPTRNVFELSSYVSFFPQLVAGPIVRFRQVEQDFKHIDRAEGVRDFDLGTSFFIIGLIKKVLIADTIAAVIDPALGTYSQLSTVGAWMCMVGYAYQLYFDFSGYSDMAVGLGYLLGIRLPQNFDAPYKAVDIADFWRRWHLSLSSFLRDYLYVPLGGSRRTTLLTYRNLMITMLLGGLWHGANWTFLVWGGYHGLLLVLNRAGHHVWGGLPAWWRRSSTFVLVVVGWVFFRSETFEMAHTLLRLMFSWHVGSGSPGAPALVALLVVAGAIAHFGPHTFQLSHRWPPPASAGLSLLAALCLLALYGRGVAPFLYFQF